MTKRDTPFGYWATRSRVPDLNKRIAARRSAYRGWDVELVWLDNGQTAYVLRKDRQWAMAFALREIPELVDFRERTCAADVQESCQGSLL